MPAISTGTWIAIAVIVVIIVAVAAWYFSRRRRSEELQERFGPEYDRAVRQYGDERQAESVLQARQDRVERLHLHPVSTEDRDRLMRSWHEVESDFVDDPPGAVGRADDLITEVMVARGYPEGDFEQRVGDLSANYPNLVGDYRSTHEIASKTRRGEASTEDLRMAMQRYKNLFETLVGAGANEQREAA